MKERHPDLQLPFLLGWGVILLLALPIGALLLWEVAGKLAATSWPKTSALIVSSDMVRSTRPALWCPKLTLRYQVDGRWYQSRRTSSSHVAGPGCDRDKRVLDARLERMRPGERITVRYDPREPDDAVLYLAPALVAHDVVFGAIALAWLGLGIHLIRYGKRQEREHARAAGPRPALR